MTFFFTRHNLRLGSILSQRKFTCAEGALPTLAKTLTKFGQHHLCVFKVKGARKCGEPKNFALLFPLPPQFSIFLPSPQCARFEFSGCRVNPPSVPNHTHTFCFYVCICVRIRVCVDTFGGLCWPVLGVHALQSPKGACMNRDDSTVALSFHRAVGFSDASVQGRHTFETHRDRPARAALNLKMHCSMKDSQRAAGFLTPALLPSFGGSLLGTFVGHNHGSQGVHVDWTRAPALRPPRTAPAPHLVCRWALEPHAMTNSARVRPNLNWQASACVATTSYATWSVRVASTLCDEPARVAGAGWLRVQWAV